MRNYVKATVIPTSIAVSEGVTTITLPDTFELVNGSIYYISLATVIPEGTAGTVISITNGSVSGYLLNRLGSNVRMGALNPQQILCVMFLQDPSHYNLISKKWRVIA